MKCEETKPIDVGFMTGANDMVNHPDHYKSKTGLETIDVIEAFCDDLNGIEAFCTANVIKYICRWKKKNGLEDLKKARWYLDKLIRHADGSSIITTPWDIRINGKNINDFCEELEKENK